MAPESCICSRNGHSQPWIGSFRPGRQWLWRFRRIGKRPVRLRWFLVVCIGWISLWYQQSAMVFGRFGTSRLTRWNLTYQHLLGLCSCISHVDFWNPCWVRCPSVSAAYHTDSIALPIVSFFSFQPHTITPITWLIAQLFLGLIGATCSWKSCPI